MNFKSINYEVDSKEITVYFDENDNAYLTQEGICRTFSKNVSTISYHLKTVLKDVVHFENF